MRSNKPSLQKNSNFKKYRKNKGNKEALLEHHSNNYCRHDLQMNGKISEQKKQDIGKASKYPPKIFTNHCGCFNTCP